MLQTAINFHSNIHYSKTNSLTQTLDKTQDRAPEERNLNGKSKLEAMSYKYPSSELKLEADRSSAHGLDGRDCVEELATTALLSESQKEQLTFEKHTNNARAQHKPRLPSKVCQNLSHQITPFSHIDEADLENGLIFLPPTHPKVTEFDTRRYKTLPAEDNHSRSILAKIERSSEMKIPRVAIDGPPLSHLFPQENCFYGTRLWKQTLVGRGAYSKNSIKRSISISLC